MQKNAEVQEFVRFAMSMCKAGYPKNWHNFGIYGVKKIKKYPSHLFEFKILACECPKLGLKASHARILRLKKI